LQLNKKEVKNMAGLDNIMEHSTNAQKVKVAKEDDAEKQRQKDFYAKLRARTAEQPTGAQYD
jgi:hypothetical protein